MTLWRLITRSLWHHRRTGIVVLFGMALATAVLTGSLLIGDSMTGSLSRAALARLGRIDHALTTPSFFRAALAEELAHIPACAGSIQRVVPAVLLSGSVLADATQSTVPHVSVIGVDPAFWQCYPDIAPPDLSGRQVAINQALADDLRVTVGDAVLLTVDRQQALADDSLFARRARADTLAILRVTVATVLPDLGVGGFTLNATSQTPRNLFIPREWLLARLDKGDVANTLLVETSDEAREPLGAFAAGLTATCRPEDYGLSVRQNPAQGYVAVQTSHMVLPAAQVAAVRQAARACRARAVATSVYLASRIARTDGTGHSIAYAMLVGMDAFPPLRFMAGGGTPLGVDDLWLNAWAAQDLGARVGDRLALTYLVPAPDGTYREETISLTLRGIVALTGRAADPGLTPAIEGITNAEAIGDWSAPFPVDLGRVTPRDETYWHQYQATPRAFVHPEVLQTMWASGTTQRPADWITAIHLTPSAGKTVETLARDFSLALRRHLTPAQAGLAFRPVRQLALASAAGSTDFGELFLSMSFFLILAAAGLAGMLLRLTAERRAADVGLMRASGFSEAVITTILLAEGALLAVLGVLAGIPLGILYGWGMVNALTTWWAGAVGTSNIWLFIHPGSLCIGALGGLLTGLLAAWWGARALHARDVLALLAGWRALRVFARPQRRRTTLVILLGASLLAIALFTLAISKLMPTAAAFFGLGAALLAIGLCLADLGLGAVWRQSSGKPAFAHLALRSIAANRSRSVLVTGLLASAAFIIIAVAANERDFSRSDVRRRESGAGGFTLQATASLPIRYDLGSPGGHAHLEFDTSTDAVLAGMQVQSFLVSPGDDVSCLNLARPLTPRLLGVHPTMIARGGFTIRTARPVANPWTLLDTAPGADGAIPAFGDADSVKWILHADLGQVYTMLGVDGRPVKLRFVGLLSGSVFAGSLLVAEGQFRRLYPDVEHPRYFLIETPPDADRAVAEALRRNLGDLGVTVRDTREVLNAYARVQNTYLAMFLALGGLGLLLGTVGLVTVLLRSALERRGEFALMLATGFRPADLTRLLIIENSALLIAGLSLGTLAATVAVLPELVSEDARMRWTSPGLLLAAMAMLGFLVSLCAARTATGGDIVAALREE